jgi:hypothetical protein
VGSTGFICGLKIQAHLKDEMRVSQMETARHQRRDAPSLELLFI